MAVSGCEHAAFREHVDDCRYEDPPVVLPVAVVEDTVFQPRLLVLVKPRYVSFNLFQLTCRVPYLEDEEGKDSGEES